MIRRRLFTVGAAAALAAPSISRGAAAAALKFIPQSDLTILDPIISTVSTVHNHGYMVFDTLFGMDSNTRIQPQMLEAFAIEDDGRRWNLKLREGLLWHDGEKGPGARLRCIHRPVGRSRWHWVYAEGANRRDDRARRPDNSDSPEAAVRAVAICAGESLNADVRHDAGAARQNRSVQGGD